MKTILTVLLIVGASVNVSSQTSHEFDTLVVYSQKMKAWVDTHLASSLVYKRTLIDSIPDLSRYVRGNSALEIEKEQFDYFKAHYSFTCKTYLYGYAPQARKRLVQSSFFMGMLEDIPPIFIPVRGNSIEGEKNIFLCIEYTSIVPREIHVDTAPVVPVGFLSYKGTDRVSKFKEKGTDWYFLKVKVPDQDTLSSHTIVKELALHAPFTLEIDDYVSPDGDAISIGDGIHVMGAEPLVYTVTMPSLLITVASTGTAGECTPRFRIRETGETFILSGKVGDVFSIIAK